MLASLTAFPNGTTEGFGQVPGFDETYWRLRVDSSGCKATTDLVELPAGRSFLTAMSLSPVRYIMLVVEKSPELPWVLSPLLLRGEGDLAGKEVEVFTEKQSQTRAHRVDLHWRLRLGTTAVAAIGMDHLVGSAVTSSDKIGIWMASFGLDLVRNWAGPLRDQASKEWNAEVLDAVSIGVNDLVLAIMPRGLARFQERQLVRYGPDGTLQWIRDLPPESVADNGCFPRLGLADSQAFMLFGRSEIASQGAAAIPELFLADGFGGLRARGSLGKPTCGVFLSAPYENGVAVGWHEEEAKQFHLVRLDSWAHPWAHGVGCASSCDGASPCQVNDCDSSGACQVTPRGDGLPCSLNRKVCASGACVKP